MNKTVQAKHLSNEVVLQAIWDSGGTGPYKWSIACDVFARMPQFPPKVVLSAIARAIRQGLADGCTCGCRGDFWVTENGKLILDRARSTCRQPTS